MFEQRFHPSKGTGLKNYYISHCRLWPGKQSLYWQVFVEKEAKLQAPQWGRNFHVSLCFLVLVVAKVWYLLYWRARTHWPLLPFSPDPSRARPASSQTATALREPEIPQCCCEQQVIWEGGQLNCCFPSYDPPFRIGTSWVTPRLFFFFSSCKLNRSDFSPASFSEARTFKLGSKEILGATGSQWNSNNWSARGRNSFCHTLTFPTCWSQDTSYTDENNKRHSFLQYITAVSVHAN